MRMYYDWVVARFEWSFFPLFRRERPTQKEEAEKKRTNEPIEIVGCAVLNVVLTRQNVIAVNASHIFCVSSVAASELCTATISFR